MTHVADAEVADAEVADAADVCNLCENYKKKYIVYARFRSLAECHAPDQPRSPDPTTESLCMHVPRISPTLLRKFA